MYTIKFVTIDTSGWH